MCFSSTLSDARKNNARAHSRTHTSSTRTVVISYKGEAITERAGKIGGDGGGVRARRTCFVGGKKRKEFQFLSSPPTRPPPPRPFVNSAGRGNGGDVHVLSSRHTPAFLSPPPLSLPVARPRSISFRFGFARSPIVGSPRPYAGKKKEWRKNSTTLPANHVCAPSLHWHRFRVEIDGKGKFFLCPSPPPPPIQTHTRRDSENKPCPTVIYRLRTATWRLSPPLEHIWTRLYGDKIFLVNSENKYNNQESAARRRGREVPPVSAGDRVVVSC